MGIHRIFIGKGLRGGVLKMSLCWLAQELHADRIRKGFLKYGRWKLGNSEDAEDFASFAYSEYYTKGRKNKRWLLCDYLRKTIGRLDSVNYKDIIAVKKPLLIDADSAVEPYVYAKMELLQKLTPIPREKKKKKLIVPTMPKPVLNITLDDNFYYVFGNIKLDFMARDVGIEEKWIRLTETEWKIFVNLFIRKDLVCSRAGLLKEVWGRESCHVSRRCVDTYIKVIRQKLNRRLDIQTIYGKGYKLCTHTFEVLK